MSLREGLSEYYYRENRALIDLLDNKFKELQDRINYLEDRHPDNCECNNCYTPGA